MHNTGSNSGLYNTPLGGAPPPSLPQRPASSSVSSAASNRRHTQHKQLGTPLMRPPTAGSSTSGQHRAISSAASTSSSGLRQWRDSSSASGSRPGTARASISDVATPFTAAMGSAGTARSLGARRRTSTSFGDDTEGTMDDRMQQNPLLPGQELEPALQQMSVDGIVELVARHLAERTAAATGAFSLSASPLTLFQQAYANETRRIAERQVLSGSDVAASEALRDSNADTTTATTTGNAAMQGSIGAGDQTATAAPEQQQQQQRQQQSPEEAARELRMQVAQLSMDFSKLGQDSSRKDVQLAKQQRRIDELQDQVKTLQHCLSLGIAPPQELVTDADLEQAMDDNSQHGALHHRKDAEDMTMRELVRHNGALAEYIDVLESNMKFGFQFDDAELNRSISQLVSENEHLQVRCQQFACSYLDAKAQHDQALAEAKNFEAEMRQWMRKHELLDREFAFVKGELERMKHHSFMM